MKLQTEAVKIANKKLKKKSPCLTQHLPNLAFINFFLQRNWLMYDCYISVCEDGYYGNMCNIRCGQCKDEHACDKHRGSCYNGCCSLSATKM